MDGQTDGWSGPITRPAFAKATQVKIINISQKKNAKTFFQTDLRLNTLKISELNYNYIGMDSN